MVIVACIADLLLTISMFRTSRRIVVSSRSGFSHTRPASTSIISTIRGHVKSYLELSKFRLSALVVVTSGAGFVSAGLPFDFFTLTSVCTGTLLCAASACTFNQVLEINKDASMKRTQTRPLPAGRVTKNHAIGFGAATAAAGVGMLYTLTNPVVAALGAANIALYAGPYTLTKPISEINTYIGGIVGAVPPVMGYYAATHGFVHSWDPVVLGSILYLWQMPHFFALSWLYREDYARGGFQMTAVNDATGARIAQLITNHSLALAALPPIVAMAGLTTSMFAVTGSAVNAYLLYLVHNFNNQHSNANARRIFLCSLWYLPALLFAFVVFSKNWEKNAVTVGATEVANYRNLVIVIYKGGTICGTEASHCYERRLHT